MADGLLCKCRHPARRWRGRAVSQGCGGGVPLGPQTCLTSSWGKSRSTGCWGHPGEGQLAVTVYAVAMAVLEVSGSAVVRIVPAGL